MLSDASLSLEKFHMNEVASAIWRLCDGTLTVEQIAEHILSQCEGNRLPREKVIADVLQFLELSQSQGLLSWLEDNSLDVLLVVPPSPSVYDKDAIKTPEYSSPPLGLCYIAAVLQKHGFRVNVSDLHQKAGNPEDIIENCRRGNPKIVGITATTPSYPNALLLARFVKAWNSDIVTVIGGPHATGLPEQCALSGVFDYICIGEGEQSMLELVERIIRGKSDKMQVAGFAYLSDGQVKYTKKRERFANLDKLPLPARDLLEMDTYYQKGAILSTRGCPIGCDFCACAAIVGNSYRVRNIDSVLDEIEELRERYGYNFFDFHDDTFNMRPKRVFDFCSRIKERKLGINWGCFCRAAQMTNEMAMAMAGAGCRVIQYGVEAGSDRSLRLLHKKTSTQQVKDAVRAAANAGIEQIVCGFIIGHAEDTEEDVRATIDLGLKLAKLGATRLTLSLLTPYPGTTVYGARDELGIELLTDDWEQYTFSRVVMQTRHLKRERLRQLYTEGIMKFLEATKAS